MSYRNNSKLTQKTCAAKAAFSVRSARTIDRGQHHTQQPKKSRSYKTRKSPVDEVWADVLESMLKDNPELQPTTLFIYLERHYRDEQGNPLYGSSCLRTLQRKVAQWKCCYGPPKPIIIPQKHIPGKQGLSDFTSMNALNITIAGRSFPHLLYHFRLVYSKWSYVKVIQGGESFQALSEGLQEALHCLDGAPEEHRTDSLAAAYKNAEKSAREDLTVRYEQLCEHYGMRPTRNNKGISHENGSVESSHGHLKNRIKQELLLRGNNDFASLADYEQWLQDIITHSNRRNSKHFSLEKEALQTLPAALHADYEVRSAKISSLSMLVLYCVTYSVPSKLAGHTVTLHIDQKKIDIFSGGTFIVSLERCYPRKDGSRYVINYRHIIHAFIKKPGAFRFCQYRDELLPTTTYKSIWRYLENNESASVASKNMLRLLKLAADHDCEQALGDKVMSLIHQNEKVSIGALEVEFNQHNPPLPVIPGYQHTLKMYDLLVAFNGAEQKGLDR